MTEFAAADGAVLLQKYCHGCGATIHKSAPLCPRCGARQFDVEPQLTVPPKNRIVAIVLALLLGGLGVHKFYLGQIWLGILYFLTCWTLVPPIVAIIEAIIYITMTDEAFALKYAPKGAVVQTPNAP